MKWSITRRVFLVAILSLCTHNAFSFSNETLGRAVRKSMRPAQPVVPPSAGRSAWSLSPSTIVNMRQILASFNNHQIAPAAQPQVDVGSPKEAHASATLPPRLSSGMRRWQETIIAHKALVEALVNVTRQLQRVTTPQQHSNQSQAAYLHSYPQRTPKAWNPLQFRKEQLLTRKPGHIAIGKKVYEWSR